jgi:hypothetical protein
MTVLRYATYQNGLPVCPKSGFIAYDTKDNATATATQAASTGHTHYVTAILAGFSDGTTKKNLTITFGTTAQFIMPVVGSLVVPLPTPMPVTAGALVSAALAASGTGGVTGYVALLGFTAPS